MNFTEELASHVKDLGGRGDATKISRSSGINEKRIRRALENKRGAPDVVTAIAKYFAEQKKASQKIDNLLKQ